MFDQVGRFSLARACSAVMLQVKGRPGFVDRSSATEGPTRCLPFASASTARPRGVLTLDDWDRRWVVCPSALVAFHQMSVHVLRDGDTGVPEDLGDYLEADALSEHE